MVTLIEPEEVTVAEEMTDRLPPRGTKFLAKSTPITLQGFLSHEAGISRSGNVCYLAIEEARVWLMV